MNSFYKAISLTQNRIIIKIRKKSCPRMFLLFIVKRLFKILKLNLKIETNLQNYITFLKAIHLIHYLNDKTCCLKFETY